ncbi:methyltransferase domain-containing protein [Isosphaeraceae bacterium EP7]
MSSQSAETKPDSDDRLPDYQGLLGAYHRAFAAELQAMVDSLPIAQGDRVLDLACGDGVYSAWLARRVGETGLVASVDLLPAYLRLTRDQAGGDPRVSPTAARLEDLPFADGAFDVVWCAQSLYSLPEPVEALKQMARVVRPGGVVAILENDTLHHVLLPWPVDVELAVRQAEHDAYKRESDEPEKFYVGRRLVQVFRDAGLVRPAEQSRATVRQAPLGPDERTFLLEYFRDLANRARPRLTPAMQTTFDALTTPGSPHCMAESPDLSLTCIDHVIWGFKPDAE